MEAQVAISSSMLIILRTWGKMRLRKRSSSRWRRNKDKLCLSMGCMRNILRHRFRKEKKRGKSWKCLEEKWWWIEVWLMEGKLTGMPTQCLRVQESISLIVWVTPRFSISNNRQLERPLPIHHWLNLLIWQLRCTKQRQRQRGRILSLSLLRSGKLVF